MARSKKTSTTKDASSPKKTHLSGVCDDMMEKELQSVIQFTSRFDFTPLQLSEIIVEYNKLDEASKKVIIGYSKDVIKAKKASKR